MSGYLQHTPAIGGCYHAILQKYKALTSVCRGAVTGVGANGVLLPRARYWKAWVHPRPVSVEKVAIGKDKPRWKNAEWICNDLNTDQKYPVPQAPKSLGPIRCSCNRSYDSKYPQTQTTNQAEECFAFHGISLRLISLARRDWLAPDQTSIMSIGSSAFFLRGRKDPRNLSRFGTQPR